MMEEAVQVIRLLWEGTNKRHYGKHYTVENARLSHCRTSRRPSTYRLRPQGDRGSSRIGDATT